MSNVWLTGFSTSIAQPICNLFPTIGAFTGGTIVTVHGDVKLVDTSLYSSFFGQTLPSDANEWTASLTGSGSYQASFNGLTLTSGILAGSSASIATTASYEAFDAALTVLPTLPGTARATEVDPVTFSYMIDGSNYAQIIVRRVGIVSQTQFYIDTVIASSVETSGILISGGIVLFPQSLQLQIVRFQNYLFLFVNGEQIAQTSQFAGTGAGAFSVSTQNLAENTKVSAVLSTFILRSQVLIGGQLLEDKVDFALRRITGTVPATSISMLGDAPIVIFGPWGYTTPSTPFVYDLPSNGVLIGGNTTITLNNYNI